MDSIVRAIAMFVLALIAGMGPVSPSFAQQRCTAIEFPAGKDTIFLSGLAPADDIACYALDTQVGQKISLKVLRGDNTVFGIADVQDAVDVFTFTAQRTNYEINVGQLMRATGPERFRISVKRSGGQEIAANDSWAIGISLHPQRLFARQTAEDGSAFLQLICAKQSGTGFGISLHNYAGDALMRGSDAEHPAKMIVTDARGGDQSFDLRMRYLRSDQIWTSVLNAPRGFIGSFAAGSRLILANGDGVPIASFNLRGSSKYAKAALNFCGGDSQAVTDTGTLKTASQDTAVAKNVAVTLDAGAGSPFRDCEHCPEMVPLPPGSFMMGASKREVNQLKYVQWATPQHEVSITYPFAIGRMETTVDEFDTYVKETGIQVGGKCGIRTIESGPSKFRYSGTPIPGGDKTESAPYVVYIADGSYAQPGLSVTGKQPAVCISRNEMKGYLEWLSTKAGKHYRLPTEAEWEYAYRAGTDTYSYWGNDFKQTCDYANFADRKSGYQAGMAASCSEKIHPGWTAEVGSYKPNPWGLYDMGGNAQEAVEDCFHQSYDGAPTDGSPWTEPDCVVFTARSGDYELTQFSMRASERLIFGYSEGNDDGIWTRDEGSDERFNVMGFRVAVSLDDKSWDKEAQARPPEMRAKVREAEDTSQATTENSLQYDRLPQAVKVYVEEVRNSCKEYDPDGIPPDRMSGIRPISLSGATPALLIEHETLCSDHYSGANCSNRGCDVVIMAAGNGDWKEIFHEHLYDEIFDIDENKNLKSISATVYAGDPHCDPALNAEVVSSDSCDVTIQYENKNWVWQKREVSSDAAPNEAESSRNNECGGSYIFAQFSIHTFFADPLLSRKVDRHVLEAKGDAASWYDVECDTVNRPVVLTRYQFGRKIAVRFLEYNGESRHITRMIAKGPDGKISLTEIVERDALMRPARIEDLGADGQLEKIGLFSYHDDFVDLNVSEAKSGAALFHMRQWFDEMGGLKKVHMYYPKYWYDYHYDPETGLYISHDKYDGDKRFEITNYEYDEFGNTLFRRSKCVASCDEDEIGKFDHGNMVHEEVSRKNGEKLVWENEYDGEGRLTVSRLSANGRFVMKFVVEREGTVVKRTVGYSPKGKKLFVYKLAETVYINRDGSPTNGGSFKRFTKHNVW